MLYSRMIDEYGIELNIEIFHSTDKTVLVKSLVNGCRQTPQVGSLIIVLNYTGNCASNRGLLESMDL